MKQNPCDPVIDELREVRHRISAMCDHDPHKLVAYYLQLQEQDEYRGRFIGSPPNRLPADVAASARASDLSPSR
jgi:hypothetical protein